MARIDRDELQMALRWSSTDLYSNEAYVCLSTGKIYYLADEMDDIEVDEPPPTDLGDATKYVQVPDKRDLDLGSTLALQFTRQELPDQFDSVRDMFRRKGAYRRFKGLLERVGRLDDWHSFSERAEKEALLLWCRQHGLEADESAGA